LKQLVYFHEIQQGGHAIGGDFFNSVSSTIPKWHTVRTSEMDAKIAPVIVGPRGVKTGNHYYHTILV
jgi:hypothetical protein